MQVFARRGFQLRTASLQTRLAYTCFLALLVPGIASLLALSIGRMGLSPRAIAMYYRGSESEMSFPKQFWQLAEVSHFHLFSVPVVVLILAHLVGATPASARVRIALTVTTYAGALLEIGSPWAVRYVAGAFAWALLTGWALLAGGLLSMVVISLVYMWGPERWTSEVSTLRSPGNALGREVE
jgi:hypothetical protein